MKAEDVQVGGTYWTKLWGRQIEVRVYCRNRGFFFEGDRFFVEDAVPKTNPGEARQLVSVHAAHLRPGRTAHHDRRDGPEMGAGEVRRRMERLVKELNRHARLYYFEDGPEITDTEYDALLRELGAFEKNYPEFRRPDSPLA